MLGGCLALAIAPSFAQDKVTIEKLNAAWMAAAFDKGDAAAMAAMYTEDAYLLPPGGDMVKGRTTIEAFWRQAAQQMTNAKLTIVDLLPSGPEAAREIGTVTLQTRSQPPREIAGKYVVVWRKLGSDWKLAADISNSNK